VAATTGEVAATTGEGFDDDERGVRTPTERCPTTTSRGDDDSCGGDTTASVGLAAAGDKQYTHYDAVKSSTIDEHRPNIDFHVNNF